MICGVFGYFQLTTSCSQPVTICHGFKGLQIITGSNSPVVRLNWTTATKIKQLESTFPWLFQQKYPFFHDFLSKKMPFFHGKFSFFCHFSMTFLPIIAVFPQKNTAVSCGALYSVGQGGFEPPTSTSRTLRATNCAIARKCL